MSAWRYAMRAACWESDGDGVPAGHLHLHDEQVVAFGEACGAHAGELAELELEVVEVPGVGHVHCTSRRAALAS